jgi:excalibur calcium-binding domain-containing protein
LPPDDIVRRGKFYLDHCPGVQIDGDNDGIPCESQWCDAY